MLLGRKTKIFLGIIVVIIGIIIGIVPIFQQKVKEHEEDKKVEEFIKNTSSEEIDNNVNNKEISDSDSNRYLLLLEIPKIKLKRGVYSLNSKLNSIEYNVSIMKESTMPSSENGNLILEAHSGNASIAYFNKLNELEIKDKAYIYYEGVKYTYFG